VLIDDFGVGLEVHSNFLLVGQDLDVFNNGQLLQRSCSNHFFLGYLSVSREVEASSISMTGNFDPTI
jgi:hypothetical protein